MNVAVGPAKEHFEKKFQSEMERAASKDADLADGHRERDSAEEEFLSRLLPHRFEKIPGQSQIPVYIYQCVLPGLHRNPEAMALIISPFSRVSVVSVLSLTRSFVYKMPEVLWVIASGVNDRIFDQRGARAIIQLAWREAEVWQIIAFALATWIAKASLRTRIIVYLTSTPQDVFMAVLFALLALLLNDSQWQSAAWLRTPCLSVAALMLGWQLLPGQLGAFPCIHAFAQHD